MRITQIEVAVNDSNLFSVNLQAPSPSDRFLTKAMYGLDADELVSKFYTFGADGTAFYRVAMKKREIVMRLVLSPNWALNESYSDLRDDLYRGISKARGSLLDIYLKAGPMIVAQTSGRIKKFEVPHFNEDPEVQITIECSDPFFRSYIEREYLGADFDNSGFITVSDNQGTAPHGIDAQFTFLNAVPNFVISDEEVSPNWSFTVAPSGGFLVGDILKLSSEPSRRSLILDRSGESGLLDQVTSTSVWPIIFPGDNQFFIEALQTPDVTLDYIRYNTAYWGV